MRGIFAALQLVLGALPLIKGQWFNDVYGQAFQMELLDDCSIYVYDHVLDTHGPKNWCKKQESSMSHTIFNLDHSDTPYFGFFCLYVDDNNILQIMYVTEFDIKNYTMISQSFYIGDIGDYTNARENPGEKDPTDVGKYYVIEFNTSSFFTIDYVSLPFSTFIFSRRVSYNMETDVAKVTMPDRDYSELFYWAGNTKVGLDMKNPFSILCMVDNSNYNLYPMLHSIVTACARYADVSNFSATFPQKFATEISDKSQQSFAGIKIKDGKLISTDQKSYNRPLIKKNYTEIPFFLYSSSTDSYYPLFLHYKFDGPSQDFTVHFVYNEKSYTIFEPLEYSQQCNWGYESANVLAAPKVLEHNETSISFEVYFFVVGGFIRNCVFRVDFDFDTENSTQLINTNNGISAYMHVQSRSNRAVNCDFGTHTVRWLLAYTEKKEAELVSLNNDVSSPIFPCSHCGSDTIMYCDVNPATASKYYSAVYIVTGQEILYVGVTKQGSVKKIEYYNKKTDDINYFVQELNFTLSFDELYNQLQKGRVMVPDEISPVDGDEKQSDACAPGYLWMSSVLFLIWILFG